MAIDQVSVDMRSQPADLIVEIAGVTNHVLQESRSESRSDESHRK